jgi:Mlc titration factor MtfA (ptsG expression regulator)
MLLHLPWGRDARRRALLAEPFPDAWQASLEKWVPHLRCLTEDETTRLRQDVRWFVAEKEWEAVGGLELTEDIQVAVAGQACLLLLGFGDDRPEQRGLFPNVRSIILHPGSFRSDRKRRDGYLETSDTSHLAGAAWASDLPVALSWRDVRRGSADSDDGDNVVLHEFAHKLDMIEGGADGVPRLSRREDYEPWAEAMSAAFQALRHDAALGGPTLLSDYGATNEAEFFAVVTEVFFEEPRELRGEIPDLYDVLRRYYNQDPAARLDRCYPITEETEETEEGENA